MFHRYEIVEGVGRSTKDAFAILIIGWFFRIDLFIR